MKIECIDKISLQTATIGTNIVSAVVAVIVLHLALGLFIYKVYTWRDDIGNKILDVFCVGNFDWVSLQAYFDDGKKSIKSD